MLAAAMNATVPEPRRRRWRVVVPTIAAVAGVALFVTAGLWQRDRMEQKQALRAQLDAAAARAPETLPDLRDWTSWRFRPVEVAGTFDAKRQILIDNKVHEGHAGFQVVAPLVLVDGRVVLVNRGWVAGGATRADLPAASPPAGNVRLRGRLNVPAVAYLELEHTTVAGHVWQNLDVQRIAKAFDMTLVPVVIEQTAAVDAADALVRDWPAPDLGVNTHRIYMVQWFTFAAMTAGLWIYFTFRRRR
ncbi:MAG: SURF1 family protein [Burkholderiales bacterium]|nr:SURF1 family protein [Burkholderiales bacterium]